MSRPASARRDRRLSAPGAPGELFEVLARNLPATVYLSCHDERYSKLYLSDAVEELTGYSAEELLWGDVSFADLLHPDDAEGVRRAVAAAVAEARPFRLEYRLRRADGSYRWVEDSGQPVESVEGEARLPRGSALRHHRAAPGRGGALGRQAARDPAPPGPAPREHRHPRGGNRPRPEQRAHADPDGDQAVAPGAAGAARTGALDPREQRAARRRPHPAAPDLRARRRRAAAPGGAAPPGARGLGHRPRDVPEGDRALRAGRPRSLAGRGGPDAAPADPAQPGGQRPRRHGRQGPAADRGAQPRARRGDPPGAPGDRRRPLRPPPGFRHRPRNPARPPGAGLRPVLHHQGPGARSPSTG